MCLKLPYYETVESMQKTAKRNIGCYKIIRQGLSSDNLYALYHDFEYNIGYHYKMDNFKWRYHPYDHNIREIHEGFHSYKKKKTAKTWYKQSLKPIPLSKLVYCVIPKGAKYIEVDGYYVSTEIIVKKIKK